MDCRAAGRTPPGSAFLPRVLAVVLLCFSGAADAAGPQLVASLGHPGFLTGTALSSDGRWLATCSGGESTVRIWDTGSGVEIQRFRTGARWTRLAFIPGDSRLVIGDEAGSLRIWDVETGLALPPLVDNLGEVSAMDISRNGQRILVGVSDHLVLLLDANTGSELGRLEGHEERISAVEFTDDGRRAVTGSADGTAIVWDLPTGEALVRLQTSSERWSVEAIAVSKDGSLFATGGDVPGTVVLWDAATGEVVRHLEAHSDQVLALAMVDGLLVSAGMDHTARVWDLRTGEERLVLSAHESGVCSVEIDPGRNRLFTGSWDNSVGVWDLDDGELLDHWERRVGQVRVLGFSADGSHLTAVSETFETSLWDLETGALAAVAPVDWPLRSLSSDGRWMLLADSTGELTIAPPAAELTEVERANHGLLHGMVVASAEGDRVLTTGLENVAQLWDVGNHEVVREFRGHSGPVTGIALSGDGRHALTGSADGTCRLWDVKTGSELAVYQDPRGGAPDYVAFVPTQDALMLLNRSLDVVQILDLETGNEIRRFEGMARTSIARMTADGSLLVTGHDDGTLTIWDVDSGTIVHQHRAHTSHVVALAFSPDRSLLASGSVDGTTRLWRTTDGEELCYLVSFLDGSWAVGDQEGRFDSSELGDVSGLYWVVGTEPVELAQLADRYFEPGLLRRILHGEPLRQLPPIDTLEIHPALELTAPLGGEGVLRCRLEDRGGGIGRVQVFVNGKEFLEDARDPALLPRDGELGLTIDPSGAPGLVPGAENQIRVVAWNEDGYLSGRGAVVQWTAPGEAADHPLSLWALVAGVSDYEGEELDLRFAAEDAAAFADALELAAQRLFGVDNARVIRLTDGPEAGGIRPSAHSLATAFEQLTAADPRDVVVVYLAGHGVATRDPEDGYAFLTADARDLAEVGSADPVVLGRVAVTSSQLTEWFKRIPAHKQVLILDTCAAGEFGTDLSAARELDPQPLQAIDRLRRRTGFHVLMGSSADQVSYESTRYGQGLLTYALLEAMRGGALREGEYVDVSLLFQYAADRVPDLTRDVGGVQRPTIAAPRGASFDVGRLTTDDRRKVRLHEVKPVVLRPRAHDGKAQFDSLSLEPSLRSTLASHSAFGANGKLVHVDADEFPGAVTPVVVYRSRGERLSAVVQLVRDGESIARLKIPPADNPGDLAGAVADAVVHHLTSTSP